MSPKLELRNVHLYLDLDYNQVLRKDVTHDEIDRISVGKIRPDLFCCHKSTLFSWVLVGCQFLKAQCKNMAASGQRQPIPQSSIPFSLLLYKYSQGTTSRSLSLTVGLLLAPCAPPRSSTLTQLPAPPPAAAWRTRTPARASRARRSRPAPPSRPLMRPNRIIHIEREGVARLVAFLRRQPQRGIHVQEIRPVHRE